MPSTTDILTTIEEEENFNIMQLAKTLEMSQGKLEKIMKALSECNLVEYDRQSGSVTLSPWLVDISSEIENVKPTTGTIILPKNQQVRLQDVTIGNFTDTDLELNIKLKPKQKEIAICKIS
jgi:predicted transcriptional regulator